MDADNVDLKTFTQEFYHKIAGGELKAVLDTLLYLKHDTDVWFEITNLVIPGENDSDAELRALSEWVVEQLGPDVPLHFSAFHPDWKMLEKPRTPPAALTRAREIAIKSGAPYAYTGNVHDESGDSTLCHKCGQRVIGRDWYVLTDWNLTNNGSCAHCGTPCAGVFSGPPGDWGAQRLAVRLADFHPA